MIFIQKINCKNSFQEDNACHDEAGNGIFKLFNFPMISQKFKNAFYGRDSTQKASENNGAAEEHQIEETVEKWNELFLMKKPRTAWNCPLTERKAHKCQSNENHKQHSPNAASVVGKMLSSCEQLRFANKALRKYIAYRISLHLFSAQNDQNGQDYKQAEKDEYLVQLALCPSFLKWTKKDDNFSQIKIALLRAYKHFNFPQVTGQPENNDAEEFKLITEHFENSENCGKVLHLSKVFRINKQLEEPKEKLKKYRKALEKIKRKMETDNDYCTKCEIPTVQEVLDTKIQSFAMKRKETLKTITQKIDPSVKIVEQKMTTLDAKIERGVKKILQNPKVNKILKKDVKNDVKKLFSGNVKFPKLRGEKRKDD